MAYTEQAAIEAEIPGPHLVDALDDDGDGQADAGVLEQVIANASEAVDGLIAPAYAVPVAVPTAGLKRACLVFACEAIYRRRQVPEEANPFRKEGDSWREVLKEVGTGKRKLDASTEAAKEADYGGADKVQSRI